MFKKALLVAGAVVAAALMLPVSASASVSDSFEVFTTDRCGSVEFVDYGTYSDGKPRDDFFKIHDYCADGHGVMVRTDLSYSIVEQYKYNGNGLAGAPVYWYPWGNILPGEQIFLYVCLVDGSDIDNFYDRGQKCVRASHTMIDG